jgi:hypothetical protein
MLSKTWPRRVKPNWYYPPEKKLRKNQNGGVGIYIEIKNSIVVPIKLPKEHDLMSFLRI